MGREKDGSRIETYICYNVIVVYRGKIMSSKGKIARIQRAEERAEKVRIKKIG
jgi:hypothetical protein